MRDYARPDTVEAAVLRLGRGPCHILAGGTDVYPASEGYLPQPVLDLTAIPSLRGITVSADGLRIGACTPWSDIAKAQLPPACLALQQAAVQIGGRQIQNRGTIGGNLCNASPAADGVPPLLTLEAQVELVGPEGRRLLPLAEFLQGPRKTARAADELLTALLLPAAALQGQSQFQKLGARAYLVISIAMVAVRVVVDQGRISQAALAVGACSATAQRLPLAERALIGAEPSQALSRLRADDILAPLAPIDDIRASKTYRAEAAVTLINRALLTALKGGM